MNFLLLSNKEKENIDLYQVNANDKFNDLKSNYILKKIFNFLPKKKRLEIIKYNDKIQKRMGLNHNDYKEYSELYSSIIIEIIPVKNKFEKFINIIDEKDEYYHIYFNNDKDEIKRNYLTIDDNNIISKIKIIIEHQVKSFQNLFYYCEVIESIYFKQFFRININCMKGMFCGCSRLKEINFSNFNTFNVTNMSSMFSGCSSITEIDLAQFDTNKVTDMSSMFSGCLLLKEINVQNFNTNNVIYMDKMFCGCLLLKGINLSNFNTNKLKNMSHMFSGCSSLIEIDISNFNTDNLINISSMFFCCTSLKDINLPNFDYNVVNMKGMLSGCSEELRLKIKKKYKIIREETFKPDYRDYYYEWHL